MPKPFRIRVKGNQHIPKQFSGEKHAQKAVEHLLWWRQKVGAEYLCAAKQKPDRKQKEDAEKRHKCRMYFFHINTPIKNESAQKLQTHKKENPFAFMIFV